MEDELTSEDLQALDELERRALRRASEAEIERRSKAMSDAMRFSPLGRQAAP